MSSHAHRYRAARWHTVAQPDPNSGCTVRVTDAHGRGSAVVAGEIDLDCAPALERALKEALRASPRGLDIDMSGVRFCDCAGLNALLGARLQAEEVDVAITLTATSPQMDHLFSLTGTRHLFSPAASRFPCRPGRRAPTSSCGPLPSEPLSPGLWQPPPWPASSAPCLSRGRTVTVWLCQVVR